MQILKDDVKEKILNVGKKLFKEKGYKETSMKDIANDANISTGNIYRYFKNKEQLIDEMLVETEKDIAEFLDSVPSKYTEINHKELFELLIFKIVEWYKNNSDAVNILLSCKDLKQYIKFEEKVVEMMTDKIQQLSRDKRKNESLNEIICGAAAKSFFEGIVYIVSNNKDEIDVLEENLKTYIKLVTINELKKIEESE